MDELLELLDFVEKNKKYSPWLNSITLKEMMEELKEEVSELEKAIEEKKGVEEEAGDVLLDAFSVISKLEMEGAERKRIIKRLVEKLKRRKPHIFEERKISLEEEVKFWNDVKEKEKRKEEKG